MSDSIDALLKNLRDTPADNAAATPDILERIFGHLCAAKPDASGQSHWFCRQADQSVVECASFLLRLFGFNGESVEMWKAGFHKCISNCCLCVQKLEAIKVTSRTTYFSAYGVDILHKFFAAFEEWELHLVLEDLKKAGFPADDMQQLAGKSLSDAPPTLLYRMLCNWIVFSDPRVQKVIHTCPPNRIASDWRHGSPPGNGSPPGVLTLLMDESQPVRDWARKQCPDSEAKMMSVVLFTDSYVNALSAMATMAQSISPASSTLSLSTNPSTIWSALHTMLRLVPDERLLSLQINSVNLRHLVTGHLHITSPCFIDVLRCFVLLLKRSTTFWSNNDPEWPNTAFDLIKDNPAFLGMMQGVSSEPWALSWVPEFLLKIQENPNYGQVLVQVLDLLCDGLQHKRFENTRPIAMNSAIQILASVSRKSQEEKSFQHTDTLLSALDTHSRIIAAVAFGQAYDGVSWERARSSARGLLRSLFAADLQQILRTISSSCKSLSQVKKGEYADQIPALSIRKQLWASFYAELQSRDTESLALIINLVAKVGYLSTFMKEPFKGIEKVWATEKGKVAGEKVIDQINDALECVQTGFSHVISKFANYNTSVNALEVLQQVTVGKSIILLLLSPVPDFQTAAQTLIGLAFDVDDRADCVRAMFVNMADTTFDGIADFLIQFDMYATQLPEACPVSRSLVRCFNDILEVLCTSPDGLLLQENFLRRKDAQGPTSRLLPFWKALIKALTTIFKRTVAWAAYYKAKEMVEWMRDAVILGRDLIQKWRVIESAINGGAEEKRSKQDLGIRTKMIACFQDMLPELSKWLRLTDEELLYQSFTILQSLLEVFKETNTRPHEATLAKLTKYIADARADGKAKSRLDPSSLDKLEDGMAAFDETSDDEVQIIDHVKPPKKAPDSASTAPKGSWSSKEKKGEDKLQEQPSKKQYIQNVTRVSQPKLNFDPPRKPSMTRMLTESDKAKLNKPAKFPTFQRNPASSSTSSSLKVPLSAGPQKGEPKNEALAKDGDSEESSDSSSEEDDTPGIGLAALGHRSPKIRKQERRQIKTLYIPTSKSAIQERLASRSKANQQSASLRLRPDISWLHKTILSWKYDHDGPLPPGEELSLHYVPGEFSEYTQYRNVFGPLLLLECWSQILRSKEEVPNSYLCKISSKEYVSDWLDLDLSITDNPPKDWDLVPETDVMLLSAPDNQRRIMAKTLLHRKNPMASVIRARCFIPSGLDPGLQQGTEWRVSKIYSLSTINREYGALISLPYLNCFNYIVSSRVEKIPSIEPTDIEQTMSTLKLNKPQATAIIGAMKTEGFVLIQGPPGTGKTSTICGLVSRFISHRPTPINVPERQDNPPKAKILICAPSNAAIDEIAGRLVTGTKKMNIVRTGADSQIGANVKSVSLDQLVKNKIQEKTGMQGLSLEDTNREIKALLMEMDSLKHLREDKLNELTNFRDNMVRRSILEQETQRLRVRRQELGTRLTALKDKIKSDNRGLDSLRRQMRREVLLEADVVCSTLSGAGHESLVDQEFEMVIIDEAAQSIELSSLIPLKFNCTRCVMVGDPQQLPPTVISQEATRRRYDQSLFLRLFNKNPNSVYLLSIQYRMHPDISRFPSQAFYEGRIEDGPNMSELTSRPWHTQPMFGTYKFFNVAGAEQPGSFNSIKNTAECQIAKSIYSRLSKEFRSIGFTGRIGIVSMYRAQIQELRRQFFQAFGESIFESVDFNTVDGFQGQEKDIIILSCVRAGPGLQSIGFLSDVRRLNVAITRAKSSLFILGNAATLERSNETWKNVVGDARERGRLVNADAKFFSQPFNAVTGVVSLSPNKKVPPPEKKPRMSAPSAGPSTQSLPLNLATPQELKNMSRKPSVNMIRPLPSNLPENPQPSAAATEPPRQAFAGTKRPADEEPRPGPSNRVSNPSRPPPPKRPKPQQTMFIPRKPSKK